MKRILLIGCGAEKRATAAPARELYIGPLFKARRAYAERSGLPWFILSAKHWTLDPDQVTEPYDVRVPTDAFHAAGWGQGVMLTLDELIIAQAIIPTQPITDKNFGRVVAGTGRCWAEPFTLEIHAGIDYVRPIARYLQDARLHRGNSGLHIPFLPEIEHPVQGLGIGRQISFYQQFKQLSLL